MRKYILSALLLCAVAVSQAAIKLPALIATNMVLQQQTNANLWGKATANATVTITTSWDGKTYETTASASGEFITKVQTPEAGGPYEVTFSDGGDPVTISNVMIGEVWYCSGQSNMEIKMKGGYSTKINGATEAIAAADENIPIRMFTISQAADNVKPHDIHSAKGTWYTNSADGIGNTSAIGYYFARYINQQLNVPVAVVIAAVGGSSIQQWMSKEASEMVKEQVPSYSPNCVLYNGMTAPLLKYNFRGMLWYQGEANAKESDCELYRLMQPAMVKDYRQQFDNGEFPFYYVQIAPFPYQGWGVKIRQVQEDLLKVIPNCGMAMTLDVGDPTNIHPAEKETVAKRLAYWALNRTYGKTDVVCESPTFDHAEISNTGQAYVYFKSEDGLSSSGYYATGFELCGEDGTWYKAAGWVDKENNRVQVNSNKLCGEYPKSVRYCWSDTNSGSCTNNSGIPANMFTMEEEK